MEPGLLREMANSRVGQMNEVQNQPETHFCVRNQGSAQGMMASCKKAQSHI